MMEERLANFNSDAKITSLRGLENFRMALFLESSWKIFNPSPFLCHYVIVKLGVYIYDDHEVSVVRKVNMENTDNPKQSSGKAYILFTLKYN